MAAPPAGGAAPPAGLEGHGRSWAAVVRLSLAFFFVFGAFQPLQALQSTVNTTNGLGSTALGVLYVCFCAAGVAAPAVVGRLGTTLALASGAATYAVYTLANFAPSFATLVPASALLGAGAATVWVSQGTALTRLAEAHATERGVPLGDVVPRFNAVFWGIFQSANVTGNVVVLLVLSGGRPFDPPAEDPPEATVRTLLVVFLASGLAGVALASSVRVPKGAEAGGDSSVADAEVAGEAPLLGAPADGHESEASQEAATPWGQLALLVPFFVYSGAEQSFAYSDFTAGVVSPALGQAMIGGVMVVFGTVDAAASTLTASASRGVASAVRWLVLGMAAQAASLAWVLLARPGHEAYAPTLLLAALLGFADAMANTHISGLLGMLFPAHAPRAFAAWKTAQALASAAGFVQGPYLSLETKALSLAGWLALAAVGVAAASRRR